MKLLSESPLAKEIAVLLAVKAVALFVIWYAFFSRPPIPSMIKGMEPVKVETALLHRAPVAVAQEKP